MLILLAFLVLTQGCSSGEDGAEIGMAKSIKAATAQVLRQEVPDLHFFPGRVESKMSIMLAAKMPGYVRSLPHDIGDFVPKGDVLAALDDTDIRARISALEQAAAVVVRQRTALGARFRYADLTFQRIKKLHDQGSATEDEFDRVSSERSGLAGEMAALDSRLKQVRAELRAARNQLEYVEIRAPSDGWLTRRMVDSGAFVMPGAPLLRFESSDSGFWFAADIDDAFMASVGKGMSVTIVFPSAGTSLKAAVSRISPASSSRSHTFSILCDIYSSGMHAGVYGRIFLSTGKRDVLLLPSCAIVNRNGIKGVFVVDSEKILHWRIITTGRVWEKSDTGGMTLAAFPDSSCSNRMVEVLTGLADREEVIVSSLTRAEQGARLE